MRYNKFPAYAVCIVGCLVAAVMAFTAEAHGYPAKPIRLIVPFARGRGPGSRRGDWCWGGDGAWPPGWWQGVPRRLAIAMVALALFDAGAVTAQQLRRSQSV